MISLLEAQAIILAACRPLPPRHLPIGESLGCVTAEAVSSPEAIPPFDNTAVDGFAVRAADATSVPVEIDIVGTVSAGATFSGELGPGQAVRIMTGAPVPRGADAIVMVEVTSVSADGRRVTVREAAQPGDHIRTAGSDIGPGETVIRPGTPLRPAHVGLLASIGLSDVLAYPRARVGVMSTGDELVSGPAPLEPGQIRDANRSALLALVAEANCVPVDLGIVGDDEAAITAAVQEAAETCDALVTSGGVSMGDFDFVKVVLDRIGTARWMQVAIRPAKPLAFGTIEVSGRSVPVFGLPGNPVSSMVSFELFARPALRLMMGFPADYLHRPPVRAVLDEGVVRHRDGRTMFARVVVTSVDGRFHARSAGGQASHQLHAMAEANGLAVVPDGEGAAAGDVLEVLLTADVPGSASAGIGR